MKKTLWITNVITIMLLIVIGLHYKIPTKISNKFISSQTPISKTITPALLDCSYELKYFDFHYKKEIGSPKIIMLGNSIVRHGDWEKLLDRNDVINRGISGDKISCMVERLKYLKNFNAKIWFIEGGINDLPGNTPISIFNYYKDIIEFIKNENAIPVINLVLYISPKAGIKFPSRSEYVNINKNIRELNEMLIEYALTQSIDYIDLNKIISDENDILKERYTTDGVHITNEAYDKWAILINNLIKSYEI
jgi:lysophospholipase L1-like esterase